MSHTDVTVQGLGEEDEGALLAVPAADSARESPDMGDIDIGDDEKLVRMIDIDRRAAARTTTNTVLLRRKAKEREGNGITERYESSATQNRSTTCMCSKMAFVSAAYSSIVRVNMHSCISCPSCLHAHLVRMGMP